MIDLPEPTDREALGSLRALDVRLDLDGERLFLRERHEHLSPKSLALLALIMSRPQQIVSKDDMLTYVWEGRAMSDAVITTAMKELRAAIRDKARKPKYIETVHGKGYRFIPAVTKELPEPLKTPDFVSASAPQSVQTTAGASAGPGFQQVAAFLLVSVLALAAILYTLKQTNTELSGGPETGILAVLPFEVIGPENSSSYFAETIQDGLISRLANLNGLKVIAKSSISAFTRNNTPTLDIGKELGATAFLEGSVQQAGDRIRLNVRLVNADEGTTRWSNKYDQVLSSANYFDIQSSILEEVSLSLMSELNVADRALLNATPTTDLRANEFFYLAKRTFELREVADYVNAALLELDKALAIDPEYVSALALKAHVELAQYWYLSKGREWIDRADVTLKRAEALAPNDPALMVVRGYYHYWGFRDYARASAALEKAMEIAPNRSDVWELSAYVARRQGRFQDTLQYLYKARELNPLDIELVTEVIETQAALGPSAETVALGEDYLLRYSQNYDLIDNLERMWRLRGEPEKAFAILEGGVALPDWLFYTKRVRTALLTHDTAAIERSLADLAEQSNGSAQHFLVQKMFEIDAAVHREDDAAIETLRQEIKNRVENTPTVFRPDWTPNGHWTPVDVPSYLGDTARVEALLVEYEANFVPDYWQTARHWSSIARALARVGLKERALDYIEKYVALYGPMSVLRFEDNHVYKDVRLSPRYARLKVNAQQLLP